jgi:selenocysteine lyase/cysteine desulfurase
MHDSEFLLDDSFIYLNHAAVAPWPRRTVQAVTDFALENGRYGSRNYPRWIHTEGLLRQQICTLINARHTDEIALLKNTSEALSVVAWGLSWKDGDNIIISNLEFPSNRVVWESLEVLGVETRQADLQCYDTPEAALIACMDDRTRLLSVSSVQYGNGLRLDLEILGTTCRERGILFCIDAIQSLGAHQFDVQACKADFVMADGHKWLLGPEGLAIFFCRQEVMCQLTLRQYGWHMLANAGHFDNHSREVAHSARRFECGSPNMLGTHALHASLELILEAGMQTIEQLVLENTRFMFDFLTVRRDRFSVLTPDLPGRYAGILTFRPLTQSPESLFETLRQHNIICALRGGGIRLSPHFYTPRKKLYTALNVLDY